MFHPYSLLPLFVALAAVLEGATAQGISSVESEGIDIVIHRVMECAKIPSLSLSFLSTLDGQRTIYTKAYGMADPVSKQRADTTTKYCLGEGTQAFTAVLLAKLIEEDGNVTWNTPIQEILNRRVVLPDLYRSAHLNLVDVLAMRSGLAGMKIVPVAEPYDERRLLRNLRYLPDVAGFREQYIHNDVLFSLLGQVFERLGDDTFQNLLKKKVLQPLGINNAVFLGDPKADSASNMAPPTVSFQGKPRKLEFEALSGIQLVEASSSLCLSANDMQRWLRFLLEGNRNILSKEALQETMEAVLPRGASPYPAVSGYRQGQSQVSVSYTRDDNAIGWINGRYRGYNFVSQDGSLTGYSSLVSVLPSRGVAAFVAFNSNDGSKSLAAKVLTNIVGLDAILRASPLIEDRNVCAVLQKMVDVVPKPEDEFKGTHKINADLGHRETNAYTGTFKNYPFGHLIVSWNETGGEYLMLKYGKASYRLDPTNTNDTFQLTATASVWHTTNADEYLNNRIMAVFSHYSRDPERIDSVTIYGFDPNSSPVFRINSRPPPYEVVPTRTDSCGASAILASCLLLLASSLLHLLR